MRLWNNFWITLRSVGKLRDKFRNIISGRAIDYAARKYVLVGEWQTDAVGSGRGRRSPSIVIRKEATRGSYDRRWTRNFHAACQNSPFPPLPSSFLVIFFFIPGTNTRTRIHTYVHTYVRANFPRVAFAMQNSPARRSLIMHSAWRRCATIESPGRALRCARSSARIDFPHNILTTNDPLPPPLALAAELLEFFPFAVRNSSDSIADLSQTRIKGNVESRDYHFIVRDF